MSETPEARPLDPSMQGEAASGPAAGRWQLACALAGEIDGQAIETLLDMLADEHPFVRWQAGVSLANTAARLRGRARLGSPVWNRQSSVTYSTLLMALRGGLQDANPERRAATADTLGLWEDDAVVPFLVKALTDVEPEVRVSAATSLGRVRDKSAVKPLIAALHDDSAWVRRAAVDALGAIADPQAVGALERALSDEQQIVRSSAVCALGHLRSGRARQSLVRCTVDADPAMRWYAARGLGEIGNTSSLPALQSLAGDSTTLFGRSTAQVAAESANAILARERGLRYWLLRALHRVASWLRRR